ncbi:unnamed protein product [Rhizophagus irregularis]|uniref:Uncharacterized protein n=1 Tax=Rhizophagus irregularis TaxID=588596 RepID=A0A2I1GE11_9GLOM|nr:hypothetical protein RhiirA4_459299 [Rhizophagus irregularis]CAB4433159.1 unnamed protein product [Rhizophagus irregularis]
MASIFKRRRAELSAIYRCRLSFLVLASLMVVAYLVIQIDDIVKEIPSIRVSYNESDSLPMPAILISASPDKNFTLECTLRDINEKIITDNSFNICSKFKHMIRANNTNAVLILPDETQNLSSGTYIMMFSLYAEPYSRNAFFVSIYDQTLAPSKEDLKISENFDAKFVNSLYNLNNYTLLYKHDLIFKISRRLRRAIKPSIFNYLGIPPQLKDEYYMTSNLQTQYYPDMQSSYGEFQIYYQNYLTVTEEQYKVKTVLNLLGLLGGAISLMLAFHALLFGSVPISPWGIIYLLPCIYKSTYGKLRGEFNKNALPENSIEISQEQIIEMQKMVNHLNRLDIYLKNCIDDETLKKLEDGKD